MARERGDLGRRADDHLHGRHALPRPGLRDPGRHRPGRDPLGRRRRPRGALQRAPRAALRLPDARHARGDRQPPRRRLRQRAEARAGGRRAGRRGRVRRGRRRAPGLVRRAAVRDDDLRPVEAAAADAVRGPDDRDGVRLDDRRAPRLCRRGRRELQHPDHPEQRRGGVDGIHTAGRAPDRRDPDRRHGRSGHARHHRRRTEERAVRDGRGALPLGDEPGHPRAARRVPDAHRPARPHGRGPVRRLHQRDDGRLGSRRVPGRRDPHLGSVQVLGLDLAHERLAGAPADLLRGRAGRLVEPVRPPDGRGRPASRVAADRRPHDLRGGDHHPAGQDHRARGGAGGRPAGDPQQRPAPRDEPRRPVRDRRRLPGGRAARARPVRAVRQGDVPGGAAGAARPDVRGDEVPDLGRDPRGAAERSRTTSTTTGSATAPSR